MEHNSLFKPNKDDEVQRVFDTLQNPRIKSCLKQGPKRTKTDVVHYLNKRTDDGGLKVDCLALIEASLSARGVDDAWGKRKMMYGLIAILKRELHLQYGIIRDYKKEIKYLSIRDFKGNIETALVKSDVPLANDACERYIAYMQQTVKYQKLKAETKEKERIYRILLKLFAPQKFSHTRKKHPKREQQLLAV